MSETKKPAVTKTFDLHGIEQTELFFVMASRLVQSMEGKRYEIDWPDVTFRVKRLCDFLAIINEVPSSEGVAS